MAFSANFPHWGRHAYLPLGCMDVTSYSLVCLPPEQGTLVAVPAKLVVSYDSPDDAQPDRLAFLWQCFCKLAWFLFLALGMLRQLRLQIVELRLEANYWRAQHRRAVQREANLKEQNQHLQGEIRELKRRLFGRKSESSAATKPPTNPKNPLRNSPRRGRGQQSKWLAGGAGLHV